MTRYAKRTDLHHASIRDGLRQAGIDAWDLSALGGGILDLAIRTRNGRAGFIEIKTAGERLTDGEEKFIAWFGPICAVVYTLDEALAFVRKLETRASYAEMEE